MLALAEPLACSTPPHELILACLTDPAGLPRASALVHERRGALIARGVMARAAVFTSADPGSDLVRLASEQDADLLLLDGSSGLLEGEIASGEIGVVLERVPCDVAILVRRAGAVAAPGPDRPVVVPFGGADHDWAALEVGAWFAKNHGSPLRLLGISGDLEKGGRDASRLLSLASLLVGHVGRSGVTGSR